MNKTIKKIISTVTVISVVTWGYLMSLNQTLWSTPEIVALIEYKDSILQNWADKMNVLASIVNKNINKNEDLIANAWDVVLAPDASPIEWFNIANSNINNYDPAYQVNQNAPRKPTVFAPFEFLGDTKNIQEWIPLFFISYFQDWNSSQEWGYTSFTFKSSTGSMVNKMYLGQAKIGSSNQIPAKNRTYTYWFYQKQDLSKLFIEGGNLNMTASWITNINTWSWLAIGTYEVIIENVNKFWFKSWPVTAWTLNIIPSSVWGTITQVCWPKWANSIVWCKTYAEYVSNPKVMTFKPTDSAPLWVRIFVDKGWATTAEYVNSSVNDVNAWISNGGTHWVFNNIKLIEGQNYITINFKDSSGKIINSVPVILFYDSTPPQILSASVNEKDYLTNASINLARDGGFEWGIGTRETSWLINDYSKWQTLIVWSWVTWFDGNIKRSGNQSLKLELKSPWSYIEWMNEPLTYWTKQADSISLKSNTQYRLSGWVKANRISWDSNHWASIWLWYTDNSWLNQNSVRTSYVKTTQDWTYYEVLFNTLPDTTTWHLQFRSYWHTWSWDLIMTAWFDDVKLEEVGKTVNTTFDNQKNMLKINWVTNINDQLSKNWVENIGNFVPFTIEFIDNNFDFTEVNWSSDSFQIVWSSDLSNNNSLLSRNTISNDANGYLWVSERDWNKVTVKAYINPNWAVPFLFPNWFNKIWFKVIDKSGNISELKPVDFTINRTVDTPAFITNWWVNFSMKWEKTDIKIRVEKDVNRVMVNWITYPTLWNTEITLYGQVLQEWENVFTAQAWDVMDNISAIGTLKIIRTAVVEEWINGTDDQLRINGNVWAKDINFNRVTPDGSAWEVIQSTN